MKKLKDDAIESLLANFQEELNSLKKHIFNMISQYQVFRNTMNEKKPSEAVILVDLSESCNAECAEEIQSHHFCDSRNQATLHTIVVYVYEPSGEKKYKAYGYRYMDAYNLF